MSEITRRGFLGALGAIPGAMKALVDGQVPLGMDVVPDSSEVTGLGMNLNGGLLDMSNPEQAAEVLNALLTDTAEPVGWMLEWENREGEWVRDRTQVSAREPSPTEGLRWFPLYRSPPVAEGEVAGWDIGHTNPETGDWISSEVIRARWEKMFPGTLKRRTEYHASWERPLDDKLFTGPPHPPGSTKVRPLTYAEAQTDEAEG